MGFFKELGNGIGSAFTGFGQGIGAIASGVLNPVANIVGTTIQGATGLINTPGGQGALGALGMALGGGAGAALTAIGSGAQAGQKSTNWINIILGILGISLFIGLVVWAIKKFR